MMDSRQKLRLAPEANVRLRPALRRSREQISGPLRQLVNECVTGQAPWPLLITGPAGVGKTCAALCLCDHAIGDVVFWDLPRLCEYLIEVREGRDVGQDHARWVYPRSVWIEWREAILGVLDELALRTKASDAHYEVLKRAIDDRQGRPLVLLSNVTLPKLAEVYDDRIASRMGGGSLFAFDRTAGDRRLSQADRSREGSQV